MKPAGDSIEREIATISADERRLAVSLSISFDGIELVFSDDSLTSVADRALERETGARGLRSIIEEILLEVQFELGKKHGGAFSGGIVDHRPAVEDDLETQTRPPRWSRSP